MKMKSKVTGKTYEPDDCVFLVNALQSFKYIDNDIELLDLICGQNDRLVFVFHRESTKECYKKWCNREL